MESLDKKYYRIAEVAALVGVSLSTLRYWETQFPDVIKPRRNAGATRFYRPSDIEGVRMVHYLLKERGLKMEAAKAELARNREGTSQRYQAVARLRAIRERLLLLREALDTRRT
ncbi:MAG: MerR family transcriptional regulator [Muribaculaceae bacterium]|nr:MerR family transcriptional regulator [Muribaculaceae bacterium]MDE6541143.1 MerR family transcriptional regulator [Muribaculaceae bacterium]